MLFSLVLPNGERIGLGPTNLIGRSPNCAVVLTGQKVSRRHAHIYELNGDFYVMDTQSNNGTYVNEVRVLHPAKLKSGDVLRIGDHRLQFISASGALEKEGATTHAVTGERTTLAFRQVPAWLLVADIRNSTQLTHELASTEYARLVSDWFRDCRRIIESFNGMVNRSTGDGLLAYWVDEEGTKAAAVLRTIIALRRLQASSKASFRFVLHHGVVGTGGAAHLGEESLSGREVHYLFRMEQALDRSCDMAVSQAAGRLLEGKCAMTPLPALTLKGFTNKAALLVPDLENVSSGEDSMASKKIL